MKDQNSTHEDRDVDSLCVPMSYIQLSLIGAKAEVWRRNAITRETFDKFTTPMCFFRPMEYSGWD